jgi:hypothetical protein
MKITNCLIQPQSFFKKDFKILNFLFLTILFLSLPASRPILATGVPATPPASTDTILYIVSTSDWNMLHNYLPSAKISGVSVWIGLNAPSESPNYSEQYKLY